MFHDTLQRANSAVLRHLRSHRAVLDHAAELHGLFDNPQREALSGIVVQDACFTLLSAECAAVRIESHLQVRGEGAYRVAAIEPDGTGLTVLRLQKAIA